MDKLDRRQFLEKVIDIQISADAASRQDPVFDKYVNKELPKAYKTTSGLSAYTGPWTEVQVRHLLRRTMFGAKQADIDTLLAMNMSDAIDFLLNNIPATPPPPLNNYTDAGVPDMTGIPGGQTWVDAITGDGNLNAARQGSYRAWWTGLLLEQNLSIHEKLVFFWHNHFATHIGIVGQAHLSYRHNMLLRSYALGNFRAFVKAVTKDAAMLMYLNGAKNIKNAPDENYAREVQELFTVGKDNPANYTEDDVKAAARVLTGWQVNTISFDSFFQPLLHDTTDKQFSAFYNGSTITGRSGTAGASETDDLIDMIFTKDQEVANFMCRKFYRFFVYYNIDATVDAAVIQPLANIFINNNFEIKPILQALLKSEHFYESNNTGCYIKTPLDLILGMLRVFNVNIPISLTVKDRYLALAYLHDYGNGLGLSIGEPPNVAGWHAFYKSPAYYELWINSSTLPKRMQFTDMMLGSGFSAGTSASVTVDILEYAKTLSVTGSASAFIDYLQRHLCGTEISAESQANLKKILLAGQEMEYEWTMIWDEFINTPTPEITMTVRNRISAMLTGLFRLPECQLC